MPFFVGHRLGSQPTPSVCSTTGARPLAGRRAAHRRGPRRAWSAACAGSRSAAPLQSPSNAPPGCSSTPSSTPAFTVVPIHPNVVKATRPRYSAAGGKSDPGDAFLLADLLRTDGHRFRPLQPPSRRDPRAARARPRPRRSRRPARRPRQSAPRAARALLARRRRHLRRRRFADRARLPRPLPHPPERRAPGRKTPRPVPPPSRLLRPPPRRRTARPPAHRPREPRRRRRGRGQRRTRPRPRRRPRPPRRPIQQLSAAIAAALAHHPDGPLVQSLPRSGAVNAAQILAELGDDRARFPTRRAARRRGRGRPRHARLREAPRRRLPVGLQQAAAPGLHDLRRQLPPCLALGRRRLPAGPRTGLSPPPRHPHPRPRVGTCPLALLAETASPTTSRRHRAAAVPRRLRPRVDTGCLTRRGPSSSPPP